MTLKEDELPDPSAESTQESTQAATDEADVGVVSPREGWSEPPPPKASRSRKRQALPLLVPEFKDPKEPRLSPNFTECELGVEGADARVKANAKYLCEKLLEPIRAKYRMPVLVTSGFRDAAHNALVGGKSKSFHLYEYDRCAADFKVVGIPAVETFDWLRLESGLPFDKVILEYQEGEARIIHLQAFAKGEPRRLAFVGETGDAKVYTPMEVG